MLRSAAAPQATLQKREVNHVNTKAGQPYHCKDSGPEAMRTRDRPSSAARNPETFACLRPREPEMGQSTQGQDQTPERYRAYLRFLAELQLDTRLQAKVDLSGLVQETLVAANDRLDQFRQMSEGEQAQWLRGIVARKCPGAVFGAPGSLAGRRAVIAQRAGHPPRAVTSLGRRLAATDRGAAP